MKRILYYSVVCFCLCTIISCTDEIEQKKVAVTGNEVQLTFQTVIPDPQEVNTRAIDEDGWGIQSLWLFNFDAQGTFIGRTQATLTGGDVSDTKRTFTTTVSSRTRIVHLLANQNLDGVFDDNANLGVHENTVMTALTTTSGRLVYWGRVDLSTSQEDLATYFNTNTIPMYRNQAWISYDDQSLPDGMTITGSAVCNVYGNGTSIPFNSETNSFDWQEKWITDPYITTPINRIKAEDLGVVDTEVNKYVFETPNSDEDEIYLIYAIQKNGGTTPRYYKVALIDEDKDPLPIYRNYHYIVHFTAVPEGNGSENFAEAQNAAPINNTWVSVDASIPSIGNDEVGTLTVEATTVIYETGGEKTLNYSYTGDATPEVMWVSNDGVTDDDKLQHSFNNGSGTISFNANTMAEDEVCRGTIRIKAGPLVRYITVVTIHTFTFEPIWCSYGVYNGQAGEDVGLMFTIPDTYPEDLLPVRCLITTDKLSSTGAVPLDVIYPTDSNGNPTEGYGEVVEGIGYKYVYEAETTGTHRIYFQTNYATTETSGTIKIEAEHFETVDKSYTLTNKNNGQLLIANAHTYLPSGATEGTEVYYELIPQKAGSEVTFQLRTDNNESIPAGVNVAIYTSNLKPVDASLYTEGESTTGGGHYYLYTTVDGNDDLRFVTTEAQSEETVRFSTVGQGNTMDYKSCIIELYNYREWTFDAIDNIDVDYGIGKQVDLTLNVGPFMSNPEDPNITSESIDPGEGFYVYITTANLAPASNETRLEATSDGYRYLVLNDNKDPVGNVTLHFQTNKIVSGEKITIRSDETIAFADDEITLTNNPLTGTITYDNGQTLPDDAFVTLERKDGTRIGVVTVTGNNYSIRLRGEYNFGWEEELYMRSTIENKIYECTTTLAELLKGIIVLE